MEKARYDRVPYTDEQLKLYFEPFVLLDAQNKVTLHWHEHIELAYVVEGEVVVRNGGGETTAFPGDLIVMDAGAFHSYRHNNEERAVYHSIVLKEAFFDDLLTDFFSMQFQLLISGDFAIKHMMELIIEELLTEKAHYRTMVKHLLIVLLVHIVRNYTNEPHFPLPNSTVDGHIRKIMQYIRDHFAEPITLSDLANHVGYSNDYVSRTFTKFTGQTLMSFINEYRCQKARMFLMSKQYNVTEAMTASGFTGFSYFSRMYKELFGVTPSQDLKRFKESESS